LAARIDAGTAAPEANQIYVARTPFGNVQLTASSDPNCDPAVLAGADKCWHNQLTLPANTGPQDIDITWKITTGFIRKNNNLENCSNGNGCNGDFGNAQRAFSVKDTRSGPIKAVDVCTFDLDNSCTRIYDQSFPTGDQHRFAVTIAIGGVLRNATDVNDPIVQLRVQTLSGQSLDCDPNFTNLKTELASGCRPTYIPNTGTPDCSTIGTTALWATPQPWRCIAVSSGNQPNQVSAGLNKRIHLDEQASSCELPDTNGHNNWHMFNPNDPTGNDGFPPGDRRILNAYLTTYGAFSHVNGTSGTVPVIGFGHFYVTGYTGQGGGFDNPCNASPPANYPGLYPDNPVPNSDSGLIVGHFIRYVDKVGGDGTVSCDPNSINACVIVMTK